MRTYTFFSKNNQFLVILSYFLTIYCRYFLKILAPKDTLLPKFKKNKIVTKFSNFYINQKIFKK